MSRRDKYHYNVREALEKDGWEITDDPYNLILVDSEGKEHDFPVDLGSEKLIAAQKGKEKIAVEIKTFGGTSLITDYHRALGQYMDYLAGLEVQEPSRKLYLGVSEEAYEGLLKNPLSKLSLERFKINVLIVDIASNNIIKWIE